MQILFKAGVHPEAPANTLDRDAFDRVWRHSVLLLQRGFKTGSILTVDPVEAQKLGEFAEGFGLPFNSEFCLVTMTSRSSVHQTLRKRRSPSLISIFERSTLWKCAHVQ